MQARLTEELQQEVAQYRRSLSSGPLIDQPPVRSWLTSIDEKLRAIYAAITCRRASDVAHHPAPQRPPRPRVPAPHRGEPRPRLIPQTTPRPPEPDQAGGSAWQQQTSFDYWQQSPGTSYRLLSNAQPHGMFPFNNVHFVISSVLMFSACRILRTSAAYFRRLMGD